MAADETPPAAGGRLVDRAHAKLNLTLHIDGRRADGFHDLTSLVVFAGAADILVLDPAPTLSLAVAGLTARDAGDTADNLVLRAAHELQARVPGLAVGAFHLTKRLPVAAGLGGGSADAAAALRLLARLNRLASGDERVLQAAAATGSDVPVCLESRARMMQERGEKLGPALVMPRLFAVLANPRVALATRDVFARLGLQPGERRALQGDATIHATSVTDLVSRLHLARNDMQAAAIALAPAVRDALAALAALPQARLTRMSGSGATCFALFDTCGAALGAAAVLGAAHPHWWVRATVLGSARAAKPS